MVRNHNNALFMAGFEGLVESFDLNPSLCSPERCAVEDAKIMLRRGKGWAYRSVDPEDSAAQIQLLPGSIICIVIRRKLIII